MEAGEPEPDDEQEQEQEQGVEQRQGWSAELRRARLVVNTEPDTDRPLELDNLKKWTGAPEAETRRPLIRPSGIDPGNPRHRQMLADNDRATRAPPSRAHWEAQRMSERARSAMEQGASLQQAINWAVVAAEPEAEPEPAGDDKGSIPVRPLYPAEPTLPAPFFACQLASNELPPEDADGVDDVD